MNTFPHHVSESRVFAAGWKRQGSAGLFVFNKEGEGVGEQGVFRVAGERMWEFGNVVGLGTNREGDSERDEQV